MKTQTSKWVIAGQPDGAMPEVGAIYEIRDTRRGTFVGKIISVSEEFADVERLEGEIHWASLTHQKLYGSLPSIVEIRDVFVYLIRKEVAK